MRSVVLLSLIPQALCAEASAGGAGWSEGPLPSVLLMVLLAAGFYWILLRPEQQRRKALLEKQSRLKKGVKVVALGILGTVEECHERTVILRMVDGGKVEFLRSAITQVLEEQESSKQKSKKS